MFILYLPSLKGNWFYRNYFFTLFKSSFNTFKHLLGPMHYSECHSYRNLSVSILPIYTSKYPFLMPTNTSNLHSETKIITFLICLHSHDCTNQKYIQDFFFFAYPFTSISNWSQSHVTAVLSFIAWSRLTYQLLPQFSIEVRTTLSLHISFSLSTHFIQHTLQKFQWLPFSAIPLSFNIITTCSYGCHTHITEPLEVSYSSQYLKSVDTA